MANFRALAVQWHTWRRWVTRVPPELEARPPQEGLVTSRATPSLGLDLTDIAGMRAVAHACGLQAVLTTVERQTGGSDLTLKTVLGDLTTSWPQAPRQLGRWLLDLTDVPHLWSAVRWPPDRPDAVWRAALQSALAGECDDRPAPSPGNADHEDDATPWRRPSPNRWLSGLWLMRRKEETSPQRPRWWIALEKKTPLRPPVSPIPAKREEDARRATAAKQPTTAPSSPAAPTRTPPRRGAELRLFSALTPGIVEIPGAPRPLWEEWLTQNRRVHFADLARPEVGRALRTHPDARLLADLLPQIWDHLTTRAQYVAPEWSWSAWLQDLRLLVPLLRDSVTEGLQLGEILGADRLRSLGPRLVSHHPKLQHRAVPEDLTADEQALIALAMEALAPEAAAALWHEVAQRVPGRVLAPLVNLPDDTLIACRFSQFDARQLLRHRQRGVRLFALRLLGLRERLAQPPHAPSRARTRPYKVGPPDAPTAHTPAIARFLARAQAAGQWPQAVESGTPNAARGR